MEVVQTKKDNSPKKCSICGCLANPTIEINMVPYCSKHYEKAIKEDKLYV